jgi:magnesium-protoporphyrin O-methyltransferase
MQPDTRYLERRGEIETYFDRTAVQAWERLTSTAPVGRIRATVRAGRDRMRENLLSWLPHRMDGLRLLDAGCGTGALAQIAAERGAHVIAIDLSPTLVNLAQERHRLAGHAMMGRIDFRSGDMLDEALGEFDHVVGMDSLIHYDTPDIVQALARLSQRTRSSMLFTFAPRTPLSESVLREALVARLGPQGWQEGRTERVVSGFYTSQAWEWKRG